MHIPKIAKFMILPFVFLIFCMAIPAVTAADGLGDTAFPKESYNINNTGQSDNLGPQTNQTKWTYDAGNTIVGSTTIGEDGTIYFSDSEKFYAMYPNGTVKWTFKRTDTYPRSSAIDKNGTIYLGVSGDMFTHSALYAIYPNGTEKWKIEGAQGLDLQNAPTISPNGTIYFSMANITDGKAYLYSVNPDSTINWMFSLYEDPGNLGVVPTTCPAIGSDGTIYVTTQIMDGESQHDSNLFAINPNGTLKWKYNFYISSQSSPAIGPDGTIYFGADCDNPPGYFYAIYPNGTQKWNFTAGSSIPTSPAIASDGTIYFGSIDGYFYALNPNGTLKWKFNASEIKDCSPNTIPVIGSDGTIYFGCFSRDFGPSYVYALNPDGTVKWRYLADDTLESNAALAKDGTLYFGSDNGTFYAIKGQTSSLYAITSSSNSNPNVGDIITLTFKVGNNGPDIAYNTIMRFAIPAGMKFISANVDNGTWSFDSTTNTVIWNLGNLTVCDPTLNVLALITSSGKFVIQPILSTLTYDPTLNNNVQPITINAQSASSVESSKTIGMKETGMPLNYLITAIMLVIGSLIIPKRKIK